VGLTAAKAVTKLDAAKLEPDVQYRRTDEHLSGEVIDSDPKGGTKLDSPRTVTLVVAVPPQVDLIGRAKTATWSDGVTKVQFASGDETTPPHVRTQARGPSGGVVLVTVPPAAGEISGAFAMSAEDVLPGDQLYAEVVFTEGEVTFAVRAGGQDLGEPVIEPDTGEGFRRLTVDLSRADTSQDVEVVVRTTEGTGAKTVRWNALRIQAQPE
jgi:hypothetical protein